MALTTTGATSLMHEAKVDIVTVPNLSEHLSNAATTAQLSARFAYAATMKSINNLLLLGDGESWARAEDRLRRPARDGADLSAGGGRSGRHPGDAPARPVARGPLGHGRQRHPQLLRHDRGAAGDRPPPAARAPRPRPAGLGGCRAGRAPLRVPPALADGRRRQGRGGAAEGAGDADLRGARSCGRRR